MKIKMCTKCKKEFPATIEFFHKGNGKFGLRPDCKECCKQYREQKYQDNRETILERQRKYRQSCKGKAAIREAKRKYNQSEKGKQKRREYLQKYRQTKRGKELRREAQKRYRKTEKGQKARRITDKKYQQSKKGREAQKRANEKYIQLETGKEMRRKANRKYYKKNTLSSCMSRVMRQSLKNDKAGRHWETLVSYTLEELKQHLENLFQPGMFWENHSKYGWHIDHKVPISSFNITSYDCEGFKRCWALENLQPLWAEENWQKNNKIYLEE